MRYLVTSDVHLGSGFTDVELFTKMVKRLDQSVCLVLNGDTIDAPGKALSAAAEAALQALRVRAVSLPVIWIEGNHDDGYLPPGTTGLRFERGFAIGEWIYITHGDSFDDVMPNNRWSIRLFKFFHNWRMRLGAHPVHVAEYAKKFGVLYRYLCQKVRTCAIDYAGERGFKVIVCGHVHFAEDTLIEGIRYINLGAWTESPCYCLLVDGQDMQLIAVSEALKNKSWFEVD